ncbi:MAG: [protein-PII] uridylyltransferase [Ignavibacteriales bacterium]|nr:MAG: [protein-PII] uridylyltransferase [Ignavibacteriaceae bacterium]MBW7872560.1 [protein-PII] uridylyltransferase [Ignavibacteria bacterium]MCZ2141887.1 [protein-PII] uridylyltransferase [Ignavibacteriales bacterium]OQY74607.1 MAG: [protein-PII] uridylyltransferase [Ignavibacteriales bacterium UTCHB3]MBV6445054.1 Bifunctional uridylyltransferase/uridylyl-removing enzyme [Ignavibacteriaceae bacterium]
MLSDNQTGVNRHKELVQKFFPIKEIVANGLGCSYRFSLEVERLIANAAEADHLSFAVVSGGSLARRELSPFSDIDITIITADSAKDHDEISRFIAKIWDSGLDISHTVREIADISRFAIEDIHTFTSLLETSFICGEKQVYEDWLSAISEVFTPALKMQLFRDLVEDMEKRYEKHGASNKMLEPNVKLSNGGLRDFQLLEWIYILATAKPFERIEGISQSEIFINTIFEEKPFPINEITKLLRSYKFLITIRDLLHALANRKNDRLDFEAQEKVAAAMGYEGGFQPLMKDYFAASATVNRFLKSFIKRYSKILFPLPSSLLAIELDANFYTIGDMLYSKNEEFLNCDCIMRAFNYKSKNGFQFDEKLRSTILSSLEQKQLEWTPRSSYFFKNILLQKEFVGSTLFGMHELGVLGALIPEFEELTGFIQHGVYHSYTADEHTIIAIMNVEKLQYEKSNLGRLFNSIERHDLLYLALLFHDIAKPINVEGHELLGAEVADSFMQKLGYPDSDIETVKFLIRSHLLMTKVAFKRDLNSPETLNSFISHFTNITELDLLYLISYADLTAVNTALWTSWKNELLSELYRKSRELIIEEITAEDLLYQNSNPEEDKILEYSDSISRENVRSHIRSFNDPSYVTNFTEEEMARHIEGILSGAPITVLFKQSDSFTNVTVITFDDESLLAKLCGVFLINDVNIHDARIFTRKDKIIIDNFNVTDFSTNKPIDETKFEELRSDFLQMEAGMLQLATELTKHKSKWWRLENKFFKKPGRVSVSFEESKKYTIIDIHSPDRLGFLYTVTSKLNDLGLTIYFAKISTMGSDIVDSFYVLDPNNKKVAKNFYVVIEEQLIQCVNDLL